MGRRLAGRAFFAYAVERNRADDNQAQDNRLPVAGNRKLREHIFQYAHQCRADDYAEYISFAARHRNAADNRCSDNVQLVAFAKGRVRAVHLPDEEQRAYAGQEAFDHIYERQNLIYVNTGQFCRRSAVTDRVDVPARCV